jgi:hypothetical protein
MDEWVQQRLAQLEAAAPPAKCKKRRPFVMVPLETMAVACAALNCRKALVWLWLMHQVWKTKKRTVPVPNKALAALGVTRDVKRQALDQLEAAGLVTVDRRPKKTPLITVL